MEDTQTSLRLQKLFEIRDALQTKGRVTEDESNVSLITNREECPVLAERRPRC